MQSITNRQDITTCEPPAQLWIDLPDAPARIAALQQSGEISEAEVEQLLHFYERGYIIFPKAISSDAVDAVRDELRHIHLDGSKYVARVVRKKGMKAISPKQPILGPKSRLLDLYVNSECARNMVLANPITRFLSLLYREPPLAFQSLMFTWGTEHSIHVDNTYIVCDPPCTLMASWVALEDVDQGCGELAYYPGSHRDPLFLFDKENIEWLPARDGHDIHKTYTDFLHQRAQQQEVEFFLARKGDVMLWHSNLVHYGTPVTQHLRTRYSLLTHYCPALTAKPNYFRFFPDAHKRAWNEGFYSSRRYDVRPGSTNPYPVFMG